jgi:hypothetical protein
MAGGPDPDHGEDGGAHLGSLLETWGMDMAPSPACVKEVPFAFKACRTTDYSALVCMSFSQAWRLVMLSTQPRTQLPLYGLGLECSARHLSFTPLPTSCA